MKMLNIEEKKQEMMRERTNEECHNAHNAHNAPNPGQKKYARLNERIGHNKPREAQRASNRIYQCMGV